MSIITREELIALYQVLKPIANTSVNANLVDRVSTFTDDYNTLLVTGNIILGNPDYYKLFESDEYSDTSVSYLYLPHTDEELKAYEENDIELISTLCLVLKHLLNDDYQVDYRIYHQAVIGQLLNKYKQIVPTFVYTYGLVNDDLVLQYLDKATTCNDFLETLANSSDASEVVLGIYIQVINALNLAYQDYQFTHYDLNLDNVLVCNEQSKCVAYLIDFEFACATVSINGKTIQVGVTEHDFGIDGQSYPMYDGYKLLLSLMAKVHKLQLESVWQILEQVYNEFFQEDISAVDRIVKRHEYDIYQPAGKYRDLKYQDLLDYLHGL